MFGASVWLLGIGSKQKSRLEAGATKWNCESTSKEPDAAKQDAGLKPGATIDRPATIARYCQVLVPGAACCAPTKRLVGTIFSCGGRTGKNDVLAVCKQKKRRREVPLTAALSGLKLAE